MKTCVVIPAFNEADNISKVISGVKALGLDVIVVDDGSLDETSLISEKGSAYVINNSKRCGKGLSLRKGFGYAIKKGYDIIISMDADGQHDTTDVPKFLAAIEQYPEAMIAGAPEYDAPITS